MTFYADLAQAARDILTPDEAGGLGASAGSVTLTRRTATTPANPWDDPVVSLQTETLLAQVLGVSKEFIGLPAAEPANGVILASDLMCICAVPEMGLKPGDTVSVNGSPATILRVTRIPAAGTVSAFKFILRGPELGGDVHPNPWSGEFSEDFG